MGLPGSWAVLFVRAEVVHPAGCLDVSPMATPWLLLSGFLDPSAPGTIAFSGPHSRGSHVRAPTHR